MARILAVILSSFFLVGVARASDQHLLVVGGMDWSIKSLALNAGGSTGPDTTTLISTLNPNVTLAYGKWYSSLSLDEMVGQQPKTFLDGGFPQVLNLGRQGVDLTFGYRITDSTGVFGGWQDNHINAVIMGMRDVGGVPAFSTLTADYSTGGPFLGASWSHSFGKTGTVGLSVAYAVLGATETEQRITADASPPTVSNASSSVTTRGFSYGVTWTGDLTGSLAYRVGVKAMKYESDVLPASGSRIIDQYTGIFFGISNYF